MGGKAMTQAVGTHFDSYPRLPQMLLDHAGHTPSRNPSTPMVQKDRVFTRARQTPCLAHFLTIVSKRLQRHLADGHNPFLGTFPYNPDYTKLKINITPIEPHQFARPNS